MATKLKKVMIIYSKVERFMEESDTREEIVMGMR